MHVNVLTKNIVDMGSKYYIKQLSACYKMNRRWIDLEFISLFQVSRVIVWETDAVIQELITCVLAQLV